MKESKDYLCYCGLYCKMCSLINGMPQAAKELHKIMHDEGWEGFGSYVYPEFEQFWKVLTEISVFDELSPLCQGGCGNPACAIRNCAREKGVATCALCEEYPCSHVNELAQNYPFLIQNGERIREIGLDAWLIEQDEKVARGVTHRSLKRS